MRPGIIFAIFLLLNACAVSEEMIASKEVYCSGFYKNLRSVGRVTVNTVAEISTGAAIIPFDVCDKIDEITGEEPIEGK